MLPGDADRASPRRSLRVLARSLDLAIVGYVGVVVVGEVGGSFPGGGGFRPGSAVWLVLAVSFFLEVVPTAVAGRTPGKAVLGMRVVRWEGGRAVPGAPGLLRSLGRWLPVVAAVAIPAVGAAAALLGLGMALATPSGRGWHDRLAGTRVVADADRAR